jgi:hypothetical protein
LWERVASLEEASGVRGSGVSRSLNPHPASLTAFAQPPSPTRAEG